MRDHYEMLRRIAAILLALATVAERAADRSRPVRWLVLWALHRAEAFASEFVAETDPLVPIAYPAHQPGNGHDEAIRLAETFHMPPPWFSRLPIGSAPGYQRAVHQPDRCCRPGLRECRPASACDRRVAPALRRHILISITSRFIVPLNPVLLPLFPFKADMRLRLSSWLRRRFAVGTRAHPCNPAW